ncbi:hypothetical protein ES703_74064 [subsurface metagenome]
MRLPIFLLILFSALDEIVTFSILSNGGVELNPKIAWLISINPLLYPLCDATLLLIAWALHEVLIKRKVNLWYIWTATGMIRLFCAMISLSGIVIINPYSL